MIIEEIWRGRDQEARRRLLKAHDEGDLGGALLAIEGGWGDEGQVRAELERLGARARGDAGCGRTSREQALALSAALVDFQGERDDYHAPHNSHLTRVLARRRGLPILLSAVWMLVGREAGVEVQGIGLPGHFLVRVGGDEGTLADPFAGGALRTTADCQRMVARMSSGRLGWRDDFLRAVGLGELLERVLRNLVNAYQLLDDDLGVYRVAALWMALSPDTSEPRLLCAQRAERLGATALAQEVWAGILGRFPASPEARQAEAALGRLERRGGAN